MDRDGLLEARDCFQKAIEMDGWLSLAYSGLAGTHVWEAGLNWSPNPEHSLAEALAAAQRAVGIDEANAEAHHWLAMISLFSVPPRLDGALAEAERAVELSPNSATARYSRGLVYCFAGRPEDGTEELKMALRLSPRDWYRFVFLHVLALCEYSARDYGAAAETATQLVSLRPEYMYGHWHLAGSCAQLGQIPRAQGELSEVLRLNPNFDRAFVEAWNPYRNTADLEHIFEGLKKAGWEG
jgi:tetratricopeptide (TPR) repeat protein